MKKSIVMVFAFCVFLSMAVAAFATITPTLNIQGTHGNYVWRPEYVAPTVSIGMQTDEAVSVEWWLLCLTPNGWKYFSPAGWVNGLAVTYQGRLFSFGQFVIPTTGLDLTQLGSYIFFFGIDKTIDGQISAESFMYDMLSVSVMPEGKYVSITIYDTFQVLALDLSGGVVNGFVKNNQPATITLSSIESVSETSDRVGWFGESKAVSVFSGGIAIIPNTANSDKAQWALKLYDDNAPAWLNLDTAVFAGKSVVRTEDNLIQYGNYRAQTIYFSNNQAYLDFACNLTDGLVSHINPGDISYVRWNSDSTGWNDSATVTSTLSIDQSGNYYSWFAAGVTGSGLFSVVLKDGSTIWLNVDSWLYSGASLVGERIVVNN